MQNKWSKYTLEIVNSENYLDRLQEIYSHEEAKRDISEKVLQQIKESFKRRDKVTTYKSIIER